MTQNLIESLRHTPAVAILGPRQIGKTTLALEVAKERPSVYLDLENPADMQKLRDPAPYVDLHADKLVILDEVQRYPDLFASLRGVIDARRREGRGNGRFLILGSASNVLLRQSAESLAGRVHYVELTGLTPQEVEAVSGQPLQRLWLRGGFPLSYVASDDAASYGWRQDFIRTYVERDIPQLGPRIPATTLLRFWTMLAHTQGELLNASKLASALGVASVTLDRYLDLMVDLMLVRRVPPWVGNTRKRLVKSPRTYVRDSGLLHQLLQIPTYEALLGHPIFGKSWEGFVIETLMNALPPHAHACFYRTAAGAEIDLVIEFGAGDAWAIEIKAGHVPKLRKGFHLACEDLGIGQKFAVYAGDDPFMGPHKTKVLSLALMVQALKDRVVLGSIS